MAKEMVPYMSGMYFGCDPEFFLTGKDGAVIGSEKVIPEKGLHNSYSSAVGCKFIQDGVQVELNPTAHTCRANLGNEIASAFRTLKAHLAKTPDIKASFATVVEVDRAELDSLSEKSRILGCAPSNNHYDKNASINVDPTFRKRSAGGHIHLGLSSYAYLMTNREKLVPLLDIFVGNTSVLIDRDPYAAERRKVYGRAGEFRLPKHGLEYRTLSNFWLRAYPLMHGMMGLCRLAADVLQISDLTKNSNTFYGGGTYWDAVSKINSIVDLASIQKAINENDVELAKKNWQGVKAFIAEHVSISNSRGIDPDVLDNFDHFVKMIDEKGIEFWFPDDAMTYWTTKYTEGHYIGFESFLRTRVPDRKKHEETKAAVAAVGEKIVQKRDDLGRFA